MEIHEAGGLEFDMAVLLERLGAIPDKLLDAGVEFVVEAFGFGSICGILRKPLFPDRVL